MLRSLFYEADVEGTLRQIEENGEIPCAYFFKYFIEAHLGGASKINKLRTHSPSPGEEGGPAPGHANLIISLDAPCATGDIARLVYASALQGRRQFLGAPREAISWYQETARAVYNRHHTERVVLFSKWEFEHLPREGENKRIIDFIQTLTRGGDRAAAENLFALIRIGHLPVHKHLEMLKGLAQEGRTEALSLLGRLYLHGWGGVRPNRARARHYLRAAAKKEDPDALIGIALIHSEEGNYKDALRCLHEAAQKGSPEAEYNLFLLYSGRDPYKVYMEGGASSYPEKEDPGKDKEDPGKEKGGPLQVKNSFLADLHLMRAATQMGYLPAVYMHAQRALAKGDYAVAAAELKAICIHSPQVLQLEEHALGQCKEGNYPGALLLSLLLGEMGSPQGHKNALFVGRILLSKTPPGKASPQGKSALKKEEVLRGVLLREGTLLKIARRVADAGDASGAILLGNAYYRGALGADKSYRKAFSRYLAAALLDSPEGYYLLGWMQEHGQGVERSLKRAQESYARMAQLNPSAYLVYYLVSARVALKEWHAPISAASGAALACALWAWTPSRWCGGCQVRRPLR